MEWGMGSQHPNKVRNLIWQTFKNSLPPKMNLIFRIIITDPMCAQCSEHPESPLHAMWSCPELDIIWESSGLWNF